MKIIKHYLNGQEHDGGNRTSDIFNPASILPVTFIPASIILHPIGPSRSSIFNLCLFLINKSTSGLENSWVAIKNSEGRWIRKEGRRPLFIHSNKITDNQFETIL